MKVMIKYFIFLITALLYTIFYFIDGNNTDKSTFIFDSIILLSMLTSLIFKFKHSCLLCIFGMFFIFLSPIDVTEHMTLNKIQYIIGEGSSFNYNRIFPFTVTIGITFIILFFYDCIIRLRGS